MYEMTITVPSIEYDDENKPYVTTKVFRYEFDTFEALQSVLDTAERNSLEGGQLHN